MKNLGVVMLVNEFPPLKVGGGEMQAARLAEELGGQGLRVGVITRGAAGLPGFETVKSFWVRRITPLGWGKLKSASFILGAMLELVRRRKNYHVIHAHLAFSPAIAAALVGRILRRKVIVKFGNSGEFGDIQVSQATRRGRLKLVLLQRLADAYIVLDDAMEAEAIAADFHPEKVIRMPNGIAAYQFLPPESRNQAKDDLALAGKTVLIFVGRLAPQKSLPTLFQAFGQVAGKHSDVFLLLVGDGPERLGLEALAVEMGLAAKMRFVGNVSEVQPYLRAADIFVLASESEGMSNALLEAMASALACVVTNVGGAAEMLVAGVCGRLVPPGQPDIMAAEIETLVTAADLRQKLGRLARERVLEQYDMPVVGRRYQDLYLRLLGWE